MHLRLLLSLKAHFIQLASTVDGTFRICVRVLWVEKATTVILYLFKHVFLLEKTTIGNVVRYIGTIDDNYQDASQVEEPFVENAVNAMLAGNEINPKTTKAIGCGIK